MRLSPNFSAAAGPREKELNPVSVRAKVVVLICLLLCFFSLPFPGFLAQEKGGTMSLQITSAAFSAGETIPKKFTCDGPDVSPKITWNEPPAKTQSFALIVDDPDAPVGTWVHWVLFDLPADTKELSEGVAKQEQLSNGARQGRNDFGKIGYGGPIPPRWPPARYFFKLYTLDSQLHLKTGPTQAHIQRPLK